MQPIYSVRADSLAVKDAVKLIMSMAGVNFKVEFIDDVDAWGAEEHSVALTSGGGVVYKATAGLLAAWPLVSFNEMKALGMF